MPNGLYSNIPAELRAIKQWCLWKFVQIPGKKPTKVPYQPNGHKCSVTNPENFNYFDDCFNVLALGSYDGLGFIFTNTEYSGIDLDDPTFLDDGVTPNPNYQSDLNRQIKIAHEFDSYSEVSPSGKGLHIIVKGKVPDGRRTNYIELYPSGRYFTMTGRVHNSKPVGSYEQLLHQLWQQMGGVLTGTNPNVMSLPETISDEEILELARKHNTATFTDLEAGQWLGSYPSQSEADQAYLNIIAYYTNNRAQVERIFRNSKLMRPKFNSNKSYRNNTLNKAFDLKVAPINLGDYKNALEDKIARDQLELNLNGSVAQRLEPVAHNGSVVGSNPTTPTTSAAPALSSALHGQNDHSVKSDHGAADPLQLPPGLLGEIAQFIYSAAPRPVPEVALAAAIGLMAGITGRAYNISGTGLNQYVLLLAMTGAGKEAAASGINKLMNTIKMQVPTSTGFIGPSEISSGSALFKYLGNQSQSFISLLGEFGLRLQQMSSPNANGSEVSLRRMFLDLYNKSGYSEILHASVYSDKANNTSAVPSPSFSILGESTPERFYGALNEDMISEGLLPRFLLIEYKGNRPPLNEAHTSVVPSFNLVEKLASLAAQCETVNHSNPRRVINVDRTSEAAKLLADFEIYSTSLINSSGKEVIRQLWNRAHIKVLKLAALVAVGENMIDPTVTPVHVNWAANLVCNDIAALTERFEAGEIGSNSFEIKQTNEIVRMIRDYVRLPYEKVEKYCQFKSPQMHSDKVVPYIYLNKRLSALGAFKSDKAGATVAIKRAIQNLVDSDRIKELGKIWASEKYGTSQRCFVVNDMSILD